MRALLQRVLRASVRVDGLAVGSIEAGLAVLLGVGPGDTRAHADKLADKIVNLRIFAGDGSGFDRSLLEVHGGALVVSQFTLYADSRKGRRPSFSGAGRPEMAQPLCAYFAQRLAQLGVAPVATGVFGAHMEVEIHNSGPVTIWLDTAELGGVDTGAGTPGAA
jgi:D-tyrosyl-tRNA(Tyr) deacylase